MVEAPLRSHQQVTHGHKQHLILLQLVIIGLDPHLLPHGIVQVKDQLPGRGKELTKD